MYFTVNLQRPWYIHYLLWLCVVCQFSQFNILLAAVTSWWTTHSKFFHIHSKESDTKSQVKICPKLLEKILLHPPKSQWKSVPQFWTKFFYIHPKESDTKSQVKICPTDLDKILLHPLKRVGHHITGENLSHSSGHKSTATQFITDEKLFLVEFFCNIFKNVWLQSTRWNKLRN